MRWLSLIGAGLLLAACGSSGKPSATASVPAGALKLSQCMRSHGVPNFPDPGPDGELSIGPGSGIDPGSPAFQSAQRACRSLLPNKAAPPQMSASEREAAFRFAQCMRANGVTSFPDPTSRAPTNAPRILVLRGMQFAPGPGIDPAAPAFKQAASRCGVTLPSGAVG